MEGVINFIYMHSYVIHPTFITIHPWTTIYYCFKLIKILFNAHGTSSLVALALLAFAIRKLIGGHTQKSFNHLNLDENPPLSLSLSSTKIECTFTFILLWPVPLTQPQWTSTHKHTIHWMPVITQLWMNLNWVSIWFHPW